MHQRSTTAPFVSHWQWSLDLSLVGRFNTQYIPESHCLIRELSHVTLIRLYLTDAIVKNN
jgi:hypothetical protein